MALNFIKKVFSFGRNKEDAPAPEPAEETSAQPAGEAPVTDDAAAAGQAFPRDGEMQFTPETAAGNAGETPAPVDEVHAGEPPLTGPAATAETEAEAAAPANDEAATAKDPVEEGMAPDALASDPVVPVSPAPDAGAAPAAPGEEATVEPSGSTVPDTGGAMQFTPETSETARTPTPPPADEEHAGEPPLPVEDSKTGETAGERTDTTAEAPQPPG
jgi:fused signal recognition particle receptor